MSNRKWFVYALVPVCALFWGFSFFGTTVALEKLEPMQLLAMRWSVSALIFIVLGALKVIKIDYKNKDIKLILYVGILQPCIYSIFETNGINLTTTSESSIFIAIIPVGVLVIGGIFLRHRYSWKTVFAIILAFAGVIICVAFSPNFSLGGKGAGYLMLFGAIIAGALYSYASNKASSQFNAVEITFGISIMGGIFFNGISFIMGYGLSGYKTCLGDVKVLIAVLFLGVCCSCICYLIFNFVLGKLPTAIGTNLVSNSTTAVGVLTGCIFAGDPFGWYTVVGLIFTITGICIASLEASK